MLLILIMRGNSHLAALFSVWIFFCLLTGRHSLWQGRNCCFSSPSEIPPHLSEYQTYLIAQAWLQGADQAVCPQAWEKKPWIMKSSIILLTELVDPPCAAVTPRREMSSWQCPGSSASHCWCFPGRAFALCGPFPHPLAGASDFLPLLLYLPNSRNRCLCLINYAYFFWVHNCRSQVREQCFAPSSLSYPGLH